MRRMLAFTALEMSTEEREHHLRQADVLNSDGCLDRLEFLDLCVNILAGQPMSQLEAAVTSYTEFRAALKRRNATYWRAWAHWIDVQSRFWVPLLYLSAFFLLGFCLRLEDDYLGLRHDLSDPGAAQYAAEKHFQSINSSVLSGSEGKFTPMTKGLNGYRVHFLPVTTLVIILFVIAAVIYCGAGAWSRRHSRKAQQAAAAGSGGRLKELEQYKKGRSGRVKATSKSKVVPESEAGSEGVLASELEANSSTQSPPPSSRRDRVRAYTPPGPAGDGARDDAASPLPLAEQDAFAP